MNRKHTMGNDGLCVCPKCGYTCKHIDGTPCQETYCPQCNAKMLRKDSEHYRLFIKKKKISN